MDKAAFHGLAIATVIVVFISAIIGISRVANSNPSQAVGPNPNAKTEVKGIVTLDDNKDGEGPVNDVEIANAISNVAADCKGRVMVDRGNYLVTVYCSPSK